MKVKGTTKWVKLWFALLYIYIYIHTPTHAYENLDFSEFGKVYCRHVKYKIWIEE